MSFFGNSSRPDAKTNNPAENANGNGVNRRSETTFLGDASQILGSKRDINATAQPASPISPPPMSDPAMPSPPPSFGADTRQSPQSAPTPPERCTNVVAQGAKWKGTIVVEDSVRVEGNFSGEIQSKGTVHIAESAQVDAKIRGAYVVVLGNFRGEIRCDQRVELLPTSKVSGEVYTKKISVHEGAILDGRVQMTSGAEGEAPRSTRSSRSLLDSDPTEPRRERATAGISASASKVADEE